MMTRLVVGFFPIFFIRCFYIQDVVLGFSSSYRWNFFSPCFLKTLTPLKHEMFFRLNQFLRFRKVGDINDGSSDARFDKQLDSGKRTAGLDELQSSQGSDDSFSGCTTHSEFR